MSTDKPSAPAKPGAKKQNGNKRTSKKGGVKLYLNDEETAFVMEEQAALEEQHDLPFAFRDVVKRIFRRGMKSS